MLLTVMEAGGRARVAGSPRQTLHVFAVSGKSINFAKKGKVKQAVAHFKWMKDLKSEHHLFLVPLNGHLLILESQKL